MEYLLRKAKLSVNAKDTWIMYCPLSEFKKKDQFIGFDVMSVKSNIIRKNIINDLGVEFFSSPVKLCFQSDKQLPNLRYITKIILGDKIIK